MAGLNRVWRSLAGVALMALVGFVAACGDDEGAVPSPAGDTGTITGNVKDQDGNNLAGASVSTNPATTFTLTDANGNFTIPNVPVGTVTVIATKAGFDTDAAQVTVAAGQTANVNLVLTSLGGGGATTGILSGIVVRRDGSPVAGVTVNIVQGGTCEASPVETATTDSGGGFLVEDLDPGTYLACVTTTIGGQEFTGRAGFVITAGAVSTVTITVGRDLNQTTEPNIGGEPIALDANGKFEGDIHFVDWDEDGTANEDCNIIFTQHLWVIEVTDDASGDPVSGVRVEWSLNQAGGGIAVQTPSGEVFIRGTTGVIVDSDDPFLDPVQAEQSKTVNSGASPQFVVDATHAVTYTNDDAQDIDFNGTTVSLSPGESWIIVTSPQEGFTDVVASSPDLSRATEPNGDKDFAIKRWVNWRIEVAELSGVDTSLTGGVSGFLSASTVADGDTIVNRLDRTPFCIIPDRRPGPSLQGGGCFLNNSAFIGVVISRLRLDSPFTFIFGNLHFTVTDDSPDIDIFDIDSDVTPGGVGFDDPTGTANDVEGCTEANGTPCDDFAEADFDVDNLVSFECEVDFSNPSDCLDVDVVNTATNSLGQSLEDMGFTITSGVTTEESAVAITIGLDPSIYFAFACSEPQGFCFSDALQDLIDGRADNTSGFSITIFDEFGEVCDQIDLGKRWVTSIIRLFKQGPSTVQNGDQFTYTVTAVNDGETESTNVIVADTLPILDVSTVGDRQGDQAFRYVTDDPTFDPAAIRYYIDTDDDEGSTTTDLCIQAPDPLPAAFPAPALCDDNANGVGLDTLNFATIAEARAEAQDQSADGHQVVIVEYFDNTLLSRTQPGGDIEAEDSFEITVEAFQSVNNFRIGGAIPQRGIDPNGEWCNIATVTSAENDFAADTVCTRVVEALLEVRKTATDAIVPAGDQTTFTIEIGNNGSDNLTNVTVSDTLDATLDLVMEQTLCTGCTISFNADSSIITINIPEIPPTDLNDNGVFDDSEGFFVVELVVRTPLAEGTFCNRVTVADDAGNSDTDLACVVTQVEIEFDIDNVDGLLVSGAFTDVETFNVGDTVQYRTTITNRSAVAATNVQVIWNIAANNGLLKLLSSTPVVEDPATITCSTSGGPTGSGQCSVTVATLLPLGAIRLDYNTLAQFTGNDVNEILLNANELSDQVENEEPTTVNP